jgi:phage-related protein
MFLSNVLTSAKKLTSSVGSIIREVTHTIADGVVSIAKTISGFATKVVCWVRRHARDLKSIALMSAIVGAVSGFGTAACVSAALCGSLGWVGVVCGLFVGLWHGILTTIFFGLYATIAYTIAEIISAKRSRNTTSAQALAIA